MLIQILLTIAILAVLGFAFAITSHYLGRGDKRVGCGRGECSSCNPNNKNVECPEKAHHSTGPAIKPHP
ncbi:MAG: hypothetical protein WBM02_10220 [bacterium]